LWKCLSEKPRHSFIVVSLKIVDVPRRCEWVSFHVELASRVKGQEQQGLNYLLTYRLVKAECEDRVAVPVDQKTRSESSAFDVFLELHPGSVEWQGCFGKKRSEILNQFGPRLNCGDQVKCDGFDSERYCPVCQIADHHVALVTFPLRSTVKMHEQVVRRRLCNIIVVGISDSLEQHTHVLLRFPGCIMISPRKAVYRMAVPKSNSMVQPATQKGAL
jgi:hypothetical protein